MFNASVLVFTRTEFSSSFALPLYNGKSSLGTGKLLCVCVQSLLSMNEIFLHHIICPKGLKDLFFLLVLRVFIFSEM